MDYVVKLYDPEGVSEAQQRAAQQRFRQVLEETLGDAALVLPVYQAYQRIAAAYGEPPDLAALTEAERQIAEQWLAAESAAIAAVYGPLRGMGNGCYELKPSGDGS
jgi:hypothetical protein